MSNDLFPKAEAVAQRCSVKRCSEVFFIKKETLAQVFSSEFCEISKNTFFHKTFLVAALRATSFVKLCCITLGYFKF